MGIDADKKHSKASLSIRWVFQHPLQHPRGTRSCRFSGKHPLSQCFSPVCEQLQCPLIGRVIDPVARDGETTISGASPAPLVETDAPHTFGRSRRESRCRYRHLTRHKFVSVLARKFFLRQDARHSYRVVPPLISPLRLRCPR